MKTTKYIITAILAIASLGFSAQKLRIDAKKSTIGWIGKKIGGQHEGFINVKSGSMEIKNDQIVSGEFIIDMNSITCSDLEDKGYNQKLVGHLKSDDFFGVKQNPTASLTITKSTKFYKGKATVTANLTIKGKTESITFEVVKNGTIYTTKLEIDRSKYDVRYGSTSFFDSLGDKAIDDIFTLKINLITV